MDKTTTSQIRLQKAHNVRASLWLVRKSAVFFVLLVGITVTDPQLLKLMEECDRMHQLIIPFAGRINQRFFPQNEC